MMRTMGPRLKRALDLACVWHEGQLRKYPGSRVPYVSHVAGVAVILARHGFADDVIVAGLLHDVIEDTRVGFEELAVEVGSDVARWVALVSEPDQAAPWEQRKNDALKRFPELPWEAQAIVLADKIDNLHSLVVAVRHHGDPWPRLTRGREPQLRRFEALSSLLGELPAHSLIDEYRAALAAVKVEL